MLFKVHNISEIDPTVFLFFSNFIVTKFGGIDTRSSYVQDIQPNVLARTTFIAMARYVHVPQYVQSVHSNDKVRALIPWFYLIFLLGKLRTNALQ